MKRYGVFQITEKDGTKEEKLLVPLKTGDKKMIFFIKNENLHDVLARAHIDTGHGARDSMAQNLSENYANVGKELCTLLKELWHLFGEEVHKTARPNRKVDDIP